MKDIKKTKDQLLKEIKELRDQIKELKKTSDKENFKINTVAKMYENYFTHLLNTKKYGIGVALETCDFLVK